MDLIKENEGRIVAVSSVAGRYRISLERALLTHRNLQSFRARLGTVLSRQIRCGSIHRLRQVSKRKKERARINWYYRQETARWGVKCSLLEPGAFKTALLDKVRLLYPN